MYDKTTNRVKKLHQQSGTGFNFVHNCAVANPFFRFKQFTVLQDHAAMRVSTDACLFGAWIPLAQEREVLDIGTGTGLLSLMLAQRFPAIQISAIELEPGASRDAGRNFQAAPWANRLQLFEGDVRHWIPNRCFDAVVCNPPFFVQDLPNPDPARKLARHGNGGLSLDALLAATDRLLHRGRGQRGAPPVVRMQQLEKSAALFRFRPLRYCKVQHNADKPPHLIFAAFARGVTEAPQEECIILRSGNDYSTQARELFAPFYLFSDKTDAG